MTHAENGDMILWLTEKLETKGMVAPYYHALSRPPVVEMEATNRAIALAGLIKNPILFVYIGSPVSDFLRISGLLLTKLACRKQCTQRADPGNACLC